MTDLQDTAGKGVGTTAQVIQLAAAFMAALGFSLYYNTKKQNVLLGALGGLLGWGVFLAVGECFHAGDYGGGFAAAAALTVYAECMARIKKTPVTVFLISGAIPLVPGAALYRAMKCLMEKEIAGFERESVYALLFAASMAAGIMLTTVVFRMCWNFFTEGNSRRI